MQRIVVTGATGNLGWKLISHLSSHPHVSHIVGLDCDSPTPAQLAQRLGTGHSAQGMFVQCDLTRWDDRRWRDEIARCDAVVHLAAQNPYPEASWADANASLDMTLNVALAAVEAGVRRVVFASSNHVMGRYKDEPLANTIGPGELTADHDHAVGTLWHTGERQMDSTPYAVAKSSGERLCRALAAKAKGRTTFVCVRIGWCQPGENRTHTLSAAGTPTQATGPAGDQPLDATEQWFRSMWLSNRDFAHLFERAVFAESTAWPHPCLIVNGMSANTGMKWNLEAARRWLQYDPQDDVTIGE
ncbi:MAG: NAD(P)-dependent oxidoreductase [Planctomycetaceae bacterium]|nr:NAD(P)-dependent oxidoreductase [Planctomycetaceae bacterium]